MSYKEELINSIEANFVFNKKPINRIKTNGTNIDKNTRSKSEELNKLKKLINSIQNCNLIVEDFQFLVLNKKYTFFLKHISGFRFYKILVKSILNNL